MSTKNDLKTHFPKLQKKYTMLKNEKEFDNSYNFHGNIIFVNIFLKFSYSQFQKS